MGVPGAGWMEWRREGRVGVSQTGLGFPPPLSSKYPTLTKQDSSQGSPKQGSAAVLEVDSGVEVVVGTGVVVVVAGRVVDAVVRLESGAVDDTVESGTSSALRH